MKGLAAGATILIEKPGFLKCVRQSSETPHPAKPFYYIELKHNFSAGDYGAGLHKAIEEKKWVLEHFKMIGYTHIEKKAYAIWITI